jgi:O-antigen/teichoic acid export membrane protein
VLIDTGALTVSSALATVLLPRTALAHAAGEGKVVRQYYLRGTIATFALLLIAAPILWLAAPRIFTIWLGNPMPVTCAILPLMLIHTVVGGSSAVGRAILLAIGKVRPFTMAVLISGVANVILSYSFVKFLHLGLRGIVLGTIVAVVGRCAIWMPWYVLKVLNNSDPPDRPVLQPLAAAPAP